MNQESATVVETGALNAPNVQRVREYQAAMAQGRMSDAITVFAPDVRYVVPGNNRLSGEYVGGEAVMGYFGRLMELTAGTYRITNMEWLVSGEDVLV